jgi:KipI family sensor histidine kinase inhibitor
VRVRVAGWSALLVETADVDGWRAELERRRAVGDLVASEIVPGERTVLLDGVPEPDLVAAAIAAWTPLAEAAAEGRTVVELPTAYDGEDLPLVARHWRVTPDEVVERHAGTTFRVAFCGFAPGFGYLAGLPEELAVPRLDTPRPRVPAGSVALAGRYCGVYPHPSPGGWLLIGRTETRLFDLGADPPALLTPGTRVRFVRA